MSERGSRESERRLSDYRFDASWQEMEDLDRHMERFWTRVHEFWRRYDAGEEQSVEIPDMGGTPCQNTSALIGGLDAEQLRRRYIGNPPTGGSGVKPPPQNSN